MAARTVEIAFLGNTKQLEAALERAGLVAKGSGDAIGDAFNSGSTKAGNALEKLGKKAEGLGIPFAAGLSTAGKHLDEASTKTGKLTTVMGDLGKATLIAGGAGLAAVGVEAVKMGIQYESAQAKIKGATGISTKAAKEMTSAFGDVGKFGESSGEQAESAYAGVAGQLQATEGHALGTAEAMKVMSSATTLNTAVQGELAGTTAALSSVMQAFHLSAGQAAGTADTLYNVSTRLDVPIGSLATAMDKLHSRLGVLAPGLSDIGGLMVSLGEHGVTGSRGVQVVNTAFQTLVGGSEKTTAVLKDLGVNIFNQQGKFIGLQNVIAQLQPKLAGLSQQQQVFAEKTLFGSGAAQIMGQVIQSGVPAFQKATDAATKAGTAQGAAAQQAKTLHGEFETAKASVETLGGDLGLILIPKLTAVAKALAEGITWLTKHKEAALALGAVIAGPLAAAITVYASQKAMSFITRTGEMAQSMYKFGARVVEVVPTILAKMGLIGSTAQATAAETAAANEEMEANNAALAASYGVTEADIKAAGIGIVDSADTTAAGVDTALGSTGVGLVLVGLGLAATELATHWSEAAHAMRTVADEVANEIINALNRIIRAYDETIGEVTGNVKELNKLGEEGTQNTGTHKPGEFAGKGVEGEGKTPTLSGGTAQQILQFWEAKGFSPAAAAGFVGNAQLESGLNVHEHGGGLYQQTGVSNYEQVAQGSVAQQSNVVLGRLSSSLIEALKHVKNPAEAAKLIEHDFEVPAGSRPGEPGYGTAEEGTAHLRQREEAALKAAHLNPALAGAEHETAHAKEMSKAESTAEKKASKAADAVEKAAKAHEAYLAKITTASESLLKKYEGNVQNSTVSALEKSLGVSTTGRVPTGPVEVRHGVRIQDTTTVSALTQRAAETGKNSTLEHALGQSAGKSVAGEQEAKLVSELKATHQKALEEMASKLVAAHKQAIAALAAEMVSAERTTLAEQLKVQATEEKDRTTQLEHSATDQLNIVKAEQAQQTDAVKAAATAIDDATQSMSASFSALTQSIEAQSKVMAAASNGVVEGIKDQTNIEVSILGERGLYGLNLIAQKEEVQLDEMKASYDQQIAQAQREDAELSLSTQQVDAADEQIVIQDKTASDAAQAKAQAHLDAVTIVQDGRIQAAQVEVDQAQLHGDQLVGNAELKVLAAKNEGKAAEAAAAAKLVNAEGNATYMVSRAESNLKGTVEPGANREINQASNELTQAVEGWAKTIREAEQALAKAKGEGAEQLAKSQQNLQGIEDKAAEAEAKKEKEVGVTKEQSQTQYAGSGLVVNQYGMDYGNAQANANELTWALTHQIPV